MCVCVCACVWSLPLSLLSLSLLSLSLSFTAAKPRSRTLVQPRLCGALLTRWWAVCPSRVLLCAVCRPWRRFASIPRTSPRACTHAAGDTNTCTSAADLFSCCYKSCRAKGLCTGNFGQAKCSWSTCYDDVAFTADLIEEIGSKMCIDLIQVCVKRWPRPH